jgi:hypothetical protein
MGIHSVKAAVDIALYEPGGQGLGVPASISSLAAKIGIALKPPGM